MSFEDIALLVPVLLFSIVAHEYAHGEAAYRQGDTTAYMLGRLTLNPLKHIDPFLTILLPIMLVVWLLPGVVDAFLWPARALMSLAQGLVGGFALPGAL